MPKGRVHAKALVLITGALLLMALSAPTVVSAQGPAPAPTWSCSASAGRLALGGNTVGEPVTANSPTNPNNPACGEQSAGTPFIALPDAGPPPPVITAQAGFARTEILCAADDPDPNAPIDPNDPFSNNETCDASPPVTQQVTSSAGVANVTINLGGQVIQATVVQSSARAFCETLPDGTSRPAFESESTVVGLTIGGQPVNIPTPPGEPFVLDIGLLRLVLNERIGTEGVQPADQTEGSLTRRALHVSLPSNGSVADLIVGESVVDYEGDVCPEGTLTIQKQTDPDEDPNLTDFTFTTTGGLTPSPFTLRDDGSRTFEDLPAGTPFTVTESTPPALYTLDDLDCTGAKGITTNVATRTATIPGIAAGENVMCVFENDRVPNGTVIVKKETAPDENPNTTTFGFTAGGGLTPGNFNLQDDGQQVFSNVTPGTYTVTENAPAAPYSVDSIDCTDVTGNTTTSVPNRQASINVGPGETVVCTFTNRNQNGRIIVKKETTPDENPNSTTFGFAAGGGLTPATFNLQDDGSRTFDNVAPGAYTVTENAPPSPYQLTVIDCDDPTSNTTSSVPNRQASINVAAGEVVSCTFVNFRPGPGTVTCPPNTTPNQNGECVIQDTTTTCPPGSAKNLQGQCVLLNVRCPPGTALLPGSFTCEAIPTGGTIVPLNRAPVGPCRDASVGTQFAVLGTNGPDRITGSNLSDRIFSFGGNDRVSGGRGDDCVQGGSGADVLDGSNNRDFLLGESGGDQLSGGPAADRLFGGSGNDRVRGDAGSDTVRGASGKDKIRGGDGNDLLIGGSGNDGLHTGNGRDRVSAGSGNDIINAGTRGPAARVNCGPGKDRVRINNNERRRIRGCEFVDVFRRIRRG